MIGDVARFLADPPSFAVLVVLLLALSCLWLYVKLGQQTAPLRIVVERLVRRGRALIQVTNHERSTDDFRIQVVAAGRTWDDIGETPPLTVWWDEDIKTHPILPGQTERAVLAELEHTEDEGFKDSEGVVTHDKKVTLKASWSDWFRDGFMSGQRYTSEDDFKPGTRYLVLRVAAANAGKYRDVGVKITTFMKTEDDPIPREHVFERTRPTLAVQTFEPPAPWGTARHEALTPSRSHT